jgi:ribonuclease P protein component
VLAAGQRLRRRSEFAAAIRSGQRAGRGALVVHIDESESTKAGFVVSRAVGNAVVRNTVRRRLRHLVRDRLDRLPAGTHVVIRALPGAGDRPYHKLGADLDAALAAARGRRSRGSQS